MRLTYKNLAQQAAASESQIKARIGYYNDGENTIAVPCDVLEPIPHPLPDGWLDENGGRRLRNNRAT